MKFVRQNELARYIHVMMTSFIIRHSISNCLRAAASVLLACVAVPALAQDTPPSIEIASMTIPFAYEQNGEGVYNDVFNKLVEGYDGAINVTFLPAARLNRAMELRTTDCIYIAANTDVGRSYEEPDEREYIFIGPVNTIAVVAYTAADAPDITKASQLNELVIASDVNLVRFINSIGIEEDHKLQSQTQMIKMLAAGRVGALIGYDFDLDFLTKKLVLRISLKNRPFGLIPLKMVFHAFETTRLRLFLATLASE